ncbi:hypothetical protein Aph01nite_28010 [Acrocarpospora phusangensis]|uniref:Uncharacterized protein n=1 Tax=Acrocarpospora phusangensis TaxID=1070424 RepID=A0A919Q948_9ACTN|nr:hypothetical protein Aph01nite_28010 [Acrocarpospora phusangensis]
MVSDRLSFVVESIFARGTRRSVSTGSSIPHTSAFAPALAAAEAVADGAALPEDDAATGACSSDRVFMNTNVPPATSSTTTSASTGTTQPARFRGGPCHPPPGCVVPGQGPLPDPCPPIWYGMLSCPDGCQGPPTGGACAPPDHCPAASGEDGPPQFPGVPPCGDPPDCAPGACGPPPGQAPGGLP